MFLDIGDAYYNLGDFRQALHNHELYLSYIEKEDRAAIGRAHGILGKDHLGLGKHKHALICYEQQLEIAKETGERVEERQPSKISVIFILRSQILSWPRCGINALCTSPKR